MSEGMDEGDIILTQEIPIADNETADTLFRKFSEISPRVLLSALDGIVDGTIIPRAQSQEGICYTQKFDRSHGELSFLTETAVQIFRKHQAFTSWPGTWTLLR